MNKLTKRPNLPRAGTDQDRAARFIEGAPDGARADEPSGKRELKKISLNISPALLARIDRIAEANGTTRAATIAMACVAYAKAQESST